VDASGSRGVMKVENPGEECIRAAFDYAQSFSSSGGVCVEEFLDGVEVGGDGILVDGAFAFVAVTYKHMRGFVVSGHSLPANIPGSDQARVIDALESCCRALGHNSGPLNFDVMVTPDRVTILEMSPRNGGNGLPMIISRATGVDLEVAAIRMALGEIPEINARDGEQRSCGSYVFGSDRAGRLRHVADAARLNTEIPGLYEVCYVRRPGDRVEAFTDNGLLIGYALFDCDGPSDYERVVQAVDRGLELEIVPDAHEFADHEHS